MPTLPNNSMSVAMPAATAAPAVPVPGRRCGTIAGAGSGESGKFLGQFPGTAMRTGCALPIAGTHKDFAVALAFFAMKLVYWHVPKIAFCCRNTSRLYFNRSKRR
jgi:hypothetical protein